MANPDVSAFVDDSAVTARSAEVTGASWTTGMNNTGSNAPGVGINIAGGSLEPERLEAWTLLDQDGDARDPAVSQVIGGDGFVDRASVPYDSSGGAEGKGVDSLRGGPQDGTYPDGSGAITFTQNLDLLTIANGWVYQV